MVTPRVRPLRGFSFYQSDGQAGVTGLAEERMYGKVQEVVSPIPERNYREIPIPMGVDMFPQTWTMNTLAVNITEYTIEPQRLVDDQMYAFETVAVIPGAADAPNTHVSRRAQFLGYVNFPDMGTMSQDPATPSIIVMTIQLQGVWYKSLGSTTPFSGAAPVADDILRIQPMSDIHWANGVDVRAGLRTILRGA